MTDTKKLRSGIPYDAGIGLAGRIEAAELLMREAADEIEALRAENAHTIDAKALIEWLRKESGLSFNRQEDQSTSPVSSYWHDGQRTAFDYVRAHIECVRREKR